MATSNDTRPAPPELKSIDRVASIPLVSDSLSKLHETLTTYTPTVYSYTQSIGSSAYTLSEPIQVKLAPILLYADEYAIKGLDAAQSVYPTPFTIKTDEVLGAITQPVYDIGSKVDSTLTPAVDRLEGVVTTLNTHAAKHIKQYEIDEDEVKAAAPEAGATDSSQVARALRLGLDLKDQIYIISGGEIRRLSQHSIILTHTLPALILQNQKIQSRAKKAVVELNASLQTSVVSAKDTVIVAATNISKELQSLQESTKTLPSALQAKLAPVQDEIKVTLDELTKIVKSDALVTDKVSKVGGTVSERVQPILESVTTVLKDYIAEGKAFLARIRAETKGAAESVEGEAKETATTAQSEAKETADATKEAAAESTPSS